MRTLASAAIVAGRLGLPRIMSQVAMVITVTDHVPPSGSINANTSPVIRDAVPSVIAGTQAVTAGACNGSSLESVIGKISLD